jgi:uncharacterized protein DUF2867
VTYGSRIPNAQQEAGPWRVHEVVPDFKLEDAWALPAHGEAGDFPTLIELMAASDPAHAESAAARFLWQLRDRLGSWFSLGRISTPATGGEGADHLKIPGTDEVSLVDRLPADLRGSAAGVSFAALPFEPLFLTEDEFAAEVSNRTVHGVMHLAWAERGDGRYGAQMAVYVKPRGLFGKGYMELIKPFRHWIVYPALMRQTKRTWEAAAGHQVG